jgi:hypothetical protein
MVVGDEEQRAACPDPVADGITLLRGERRVGGAVAGDPDAHDRLVAHAVAKGVFGSHVSVPQGRVPLRAPA